MKTKVLAVAATVALSGFAVPGGGVAGLSYPTASAAFPACSTEDQEFCVEALWFTPVGGSETAMTNPATQGSPAWVRAGFFQGAYTGPSTTPAATGLMPIMNATVITNTGFKESGVQDGLVPGTYRYRLRIGDYDPTYTVIQAQAVSHSVEKGADGHYTLEVSAVAKPWISVQGNSAIAACIAGKWKTNCEATHAYRNWFSTAIVMHGTSSRRDISRGQWFSTSATYFQPSAPTSNGPEAKQTLTVAGPHFVPNDFGDTGKSEGGRFLNIAYYRTFVPYEAVINSLRLANISSTKESIRATLAVRSIFTGTILDELGIPRTRDLTVTAQENGVLIDFNLETFSAPNPTLYISNPSRTRVTLKTGAAISHLQEATKGKKVSQKTLLAPSPGTKVTAVKSLTAKQCVVKGSSVTMVKVGTCRLSVSATTKVGKKTKTASKKVLITVR